MQSNKEVKKPQEPLTKEELTDFLERHINNLTKLGIDTSNFKKILKNLKGGIKRQKL